MSYCFKPTKELVSSILPVLEKDMKKTLDSDPELQRMMIENGGSLSEALDPQMIIDDLSDAIHGASTSLSRTRKHGEEVLISSGYCFTDDYLSCLKAGIFDEAATWPDEFYQKLAKEMTDWVGRADGELTDPAGFDYEARGDSLYITMKKEGQPFDVKKHLDAILADESRWKIT